MSRDPILDEAFSKRLAVKRVADAARISTAAVSQWQRVPEKHIDVVEGVTGIPRHRLRPDICPPPTAADLVVAQ